MNQFFRPDRTFSSDERALLSRLIASKFTGWQEVAEQLQQCAVRDIDEFGVARWGSLILVSAGEFPAKVDNDVPVEAEGVDSDGIGIFVRLHLSDGVVRELEIEKNDFTPIQHLDIDHLKVWVNTST